MNTPTSESEETTSIALQTLRSLKTAEVLLFTALVTCLVVSGSFILFTFDRELFLAVDTFKLLLLSAAITLPVLGINLFIVWIASGKLKASLKDLSMLSGFVSSAVFYVPLIAHYFVYSFSNTQFLNSVVVAELIVVILASMILDKTYPDSAH